VLLTGEQDAYYQDFHGVDDLAGAYRDGFVYSGQYSNYRRKRYGISSKRIAAKRFVVFSQNHDQVGNRSVGDRLSQSLPFEQLKLAAGTVLLSPYIPLLFMGEEYAETAPFQYFVSHGDPALIDAVRKGRKNEFAEFGWASEIPDPQSEATFLGCKLNWNLHAEGQHRVLWNFYQELLRLRRDISALANLDKDAMEVTPFTDRKVLLVRRWDASGQVLIAHNFDRIATDIKVTIPEGNWRTVLDSNEERWHGGRGATTDEFQSNGEIQLRLTPWVFLVLWQNAPETRRP
jgi:maltooligosyltrehalose trehalohydrolase